MRLFNLPDRRIGVVRCLDEDDSDEICDIIYEDQWAEGDGWEY